MNVVCWQRLVYKFENPNCQYMQSCHHSNNTCMSEATELEQLTKSLSNIISALNDIATKNSADTPSLLPPQRPRIIKTPDMTYHEYLSKVLQNRPPVQAVARASYRLQEDLQLLMELSTFSNITHKCFEEIAERKSVLRPVESLRSRYNDYLSKIGEPEMKKIVTWVEREGLLGFLYFEGKELRISPTDPKELKTEKQEEISPEKPAERSDKKRGRNQSLEKGEKKFQKGQGKKVPTNCKELNDILKLYSKMVNIPIKTLLQQLDQVSGDFMQLDNYIENKDSKVLWTAEEDEILRRGGAEVQLLRRYRGATVDARMKYLGINP